MFLVMISFFITMTLVIYFFLSFFDRGKKHDIEKEKRRRLAHFTGEDGELFVGEKDDSSLVGRIFLPFWRELRRSFKKKMPGEKQAKIEVKLLQAGNPFGITAVEYRLGQISLAILLPIIVGIWSIFADIGLGGQLFMIIIAVVVGLFLPSMYIKSKTQQRYKQALKELPDTLDLLTVSLEAGLGFDAALSKLVQKRSGVLSQEFHRSLEEIRLGKTRKEALNGIRERLAVDQVSNVIGNIIQAERLGIGLVQVMRVQSADVRDQRKQRAEEEAMKAPVKMLFPLVLFIFPSIFIVVVGPAAIGFVDAMSSM
ncbi:type II secretion system F family protein [Caldalkalibacillus salinus]|uniref:type II secretion system F family protein n=1 Tax=Caldalkalibacillus salinus TaxID=2803787 RepID=UPI001F30F9D3|nr:type II secretion system F family protein [Caldalkalibacillus salinus]